MGRLSAPNVLDWYTQDCLGDQPDQSRRPLPGAATIGMDTRAANQATAICSMCMRSSVTLRHALLQRHRNREHDQPILPSSHIFQPFLGTTIRSSLPPHALGTCRGGVSGRLCVQSIRRPLLTNSSSMCSSRVRSCQSDTLYRCPGSKHPTCRMFSSSLYTGCLIDLEHMGHSPRMLTSLPLEIITYAFSQQLRHRPLLQRIALGRPVYYWPFRQHQARYCKRYFAFNVNQRVSCLH